MSFFWNEVKRRLNEEDRSYTWLAKKVGVTRNTLKSWAYNDRLPRADEALAIADALGENAFYIVSGNEDVKRENNRKKKDMIISLLDHADKETIDVVYDLLLARVKKGS